MRTVVSVVCLFVVAVAGIYLVLSAPGMAESGEVSGGAIAALVVAVVCAVVTRRLNPSRTRNNLTNNG